MGRVGWQFAVSAISDGVVRCHQFPGQTAITRGINTSSVLHIAVVTVCVVGVEEVIEIHRWTIGGSITLEAEAVGHQ